MSAFSPTFSSNRNMPRQAAPTAGWATCDRMSAAALAFSSSGVNGDGGKMKLPSGRSKHPSSVRSARSNASRTSPKAIASCANMSGRCAPWPGKSTAIFASCRSGFSAK